VSYDVIFIPRTADQPWEQAIEAAEDAEDAGPRLADPAWRAIVAAARGLLGEVADDSDRDVRELEHLDSGLELSAWTREASLSLPFTHTGEAARRYLGALFELAAVVARESGLQGYDLQTDRPLAEVGDYFDDALDLYTHTAEGNVE
jgi:hypothetical protein